MLLNTFSSTPLFLFYLLLFLTLELHLKMVYLQMLRQVLNQVILMKKSRNLESDLFLLISLLPFDETLFKLRNHPRTSQQKFSHLVEQLPLNPVMYPGHYFFINFLGVKKRVNTKRTINNIIFAFGVCLFFVFS